MQMVNCTKAETPEEMHMTCFLQLARFEIFTAVAVNITVVWDVAPFTVVEIYLCVQERAVSQKTVIFMQYQPHLCLSNDIAQAVT
jgi:hypothetical protein